MRLEALRNALGGVAIGQPEAVAGLLLGLVAREHVWLEGPTGCGKTRLAEALGALCGARTARLAPEHELTLRRYEVGTGERVVRETPASQLLGAEIAVLDDPARAKGADLAPLLGVLARRRSGQRALPLEMAVATGLPPGRSRSDEPLGAGALDVFAVQVRMRGLLLAGAFEAARRLVEAPDAGPLRAVIDRDARRAAQAAAARLEVTSAAELALRGALARLRELADAVPSALLSDRTFAPAALRLMRAHAWLRGAPRVEAADVSVLEFTLARRVPRALHAEATQRVREAATPVGGSGAQAAGAGGGSGASDEPVAPYLDSALDPEPPAPCVPDAEIDALVAALGGRMARGRASRHEDPAGVPRSWRRLRGLDEVLDADPGEAWLWASGRTPDTPRVPRRERRARGGAVVELRDVSASMEGRLGAWAGDVVRALAALGRRRRIKLGYVEFNHAAQRFSYAHRFFHGRYDAIAALGARRRCEGRTSYQAPLVVALEELARTPERERHVVLLTDGVPVVGDPEVRAELAAARRLGVRVHTVFLGTGPRPEVLDRLALETGGLGFRARPRAGRGICVEVVCTSA